MTGLGERLLYQGLKGKVLETAGMLATSMFREENYNNTRTKRSVVAFPCGRYYCNCKLVKH